MSLLKQANEVLRKKDYKLAIDLYIAVLSKNPGMNKSIRFNLGYAKSKLNGTNLRKDFINQDIERCIEVEESTLMTGPKSKNKCIVKFENITGNFISGWSLDTEEKNNTVVLEVLLDKKPYSIIETASMRNDVKKVHGGEGFNGFKGELNQYSTFSKESIIQINPLSHRLDDSANNTIAKNFLPMLRGVHFKDVNETATSVVGKFIHQSASISEKNSKISVIILNLNGAEVLKECIESILKFNNEAEIIVIDHASIDSSIEMLKSYKTNRIKVIVRDKNYSYSDSNNLGAREASGDILIFMNNDIILTSDAIIKMKTIIEQGKFGLLGIKLWDLPKSNNFKLESSVRVNQHLGVHFKGLNRTETIEAFEVRNSSFIDLENGILETPAITAAMMAITKADFLEIGGFNNKYFYGQEDVDFCLRYYRHFEKKIGTLLEDGAYHIRGLSRKTLSKNNKTYVNNNRVILQEELGSWFRNEFRIGQFVKPGFWNQKPLSIAMIVSEVSFETDKADFFTAKELGDAFEENTNIVVGYFDVNSDYDVTGYDVVMVYIDGFNPKKLKNLSPHAVLVGWARNWFNRWCDRTWIEMFDVLYASSEFARKYMQDRLKRKVDLLRIAASSDCFEKSTSKKEFESDYVFTGSYFNSPREITEALNPETLPYKFKLYGHNWKNHPKFKNYTMGPVSYMDIPKVYANTKLVVDDANIATKKWGALNCRIYDSLASGVLCITNNHLGVSEIFEEDYPVYDRDDANIKINELLSGADRERLAKKYQEMVLTQHTYTHRKDSILEDIKKLVKKTTIAIKIAAPDFERGVKWGDYYFAVALRKELEILNYKVRIDCLDQWHSERALNDDVNIVLRGLNRFKVRKDQLNILWIISHPDLVSEEELRDYDHIYIASELYAKKLKNFTELNNIEFLPQATSFDISQLDPVITDEVPEHEILFIGNSRNEYREVVKWCVENNLPISVYGGGWEQYIDKKYIKGEFISNELLPYYYHNAGVVLNDHWADMRKNGFISNRVYDVLAVNGRLLSDEVVGLNKLSENVKVYTTKKDFLKQIKYLRTNKKNQNDLKRTPFLSFSNRASAISKLVQDRVKNNAGVWGGENHRYNHYLSFGFNCEVSFILEKLNLFDSNLFSWADVRGTKALINSISKSESLLAGNVIRYSNNMFYDEDLKIGFHGKIKFETATEKQILNSLDETRERIQYLSKKTFKILHEGDSLIIVKWMSDIFDEEYTPLESATLLIETLNSFINNNFDVLYVLEGNNVVVDKQIQGRNFFMRSVSKFAPRSSANEYIEEEWRKVISEFI